MCLAVPGKVVEIMDDGDIAGKYVLVHVGFAISVIDEDEAQRVFKYLEEMGGLQEELGEIPQ